ncbi:MAG TPA: XdhC/CoxI family protein [Proteobacteria bacterium]|nr:XdhC/CoxI family protein [Pseudomonadota bacterium]
MEFCWKDLLQTLEKEGRAALCTIIERRGSVPREVGARMLVRPDGSISGTIGGGIGEHEVIKAALQNLHLGLSRELNFSLAGEQGLDSAAICGGNFTIFIACWEKNEDGDLAAGICVNLEQGKTPWLLETRPQGGPGKTLRALYNQEHRQAITTFGKSGVPPLHLNPPTIDTNPEAAVRPVEIAGLDCLLSHIIPAPQMIIFGGGHLARPLVEMAAWCRFAVTVIDDRPEFSNRERFPAADRVLTADMEDIRGFHQPGPQVYLILITREHKHDYILLKQLLGTEYAYLGMIGSRRRTSQVKQRLLDEGFSENEIKRLCSPIGLEIGAQTPAEIAISIMAEIILKKHQQGA